MSHFAKIDDDNIVTEVIVAEQDFIDSGAVGDSLSWIQTSYNTSGGVHHCGGIEYVTEPVEAVDAVPYTDKDILPDGKEVGDVMIPAVEAVEAVYVEGKSPEDVGKPDGGVALRKNYAGIGHTYDATRDAFYAQQPYPSWTLNEDTCHWEAPVAHPFDGKVYYWDEDITNWVEVS